MKYLWDLLFPPRCPFCSARLPFGKRGACVICEKTLPYVEPGNILRKVGKHTCAVTFYYEKAVRSGIHTFKFGGKVRRAREFAPYLAETVSEVFGGEFDAVTYVPISEQRRFRRGFDQSRVLAEQCCALWGVEVEHTLRKVRNNPPQSTVKTAKARQKNVQNVFRVRNRAAVAGRRFLLIDDITTSGSTLAACADLLLEAGAVSVVCAALAGARNENVSGI